MAGYERRQVAPAKACRELTSPVWADIARFGRDTGALRGVTPESVILESMRVFFEDERMRAKGWPIAFLAQNPSEFFNRADHSRLVVNEPISERVRAVLLDAYRSAHEAELHTAWPGPVPDDEPSVEVIVDWCAAQRVPLEAARAVVEGAFKFDAWRRYGWPWSRIAADPGHCAALSTRSLAGQLGEGDERPAHELIPKVDVTTPLTEEERRLSW